MTRAIVYLRQSKDTEDTRAAVDRQLEECQSLCEQNEWTVVRTHTDNDVSATSKKARPGYKALLDDVEAGACDVIVAWAQDRLLRKVADMLELIELCQKHKVSVVTVQAAGSTCQPRTGRRSPCWPR